jgi:hypothetical protein
MIPVLPAKPERPLPRHKSRALVLALRTVDRQALLIRELRLQVRALKHGVAFDLVPLELPCREKEMAGEVKELMKPYNLLILRSRCRLRPVSATRHAVMRHLRGKGYALHEIAQFLCVHHTAVVYALKGNL